MANGERAQRKGGAPAGKPPKANPQAEHGERESFADAVADVAVGAAEGALRSTPAGGAVAGALEKIPWDKLIAALLEGAKAKKDKDFLKSFVKAVLSIDNLKDLLIKLIDDSPVPDKEKGWIEGAFQGFYDWLNGNGDAALARARKKKASEELKPLIRQAEDLAHSIGRMIDRDDFDEARKNLKDSLVPLLEKIRAWISANVK